MEMEEFNIHFLLATKGYTIKVARKLIVECREDIEMFGLEYAQKKWAKFIKKEVIDAPPNDN